MKNNNNNQSSVYDMAWGMSFVFNYGFILIVPILLGLFGGLKLDSKFGTKPWLTLLLMLLGGMLGFISGYRYIKSYLNSTTSVNKNSNTLNTKSKQGES